jgi:hypothetical protein
MLAAGGHWYRRRSRRAAESPIEQVLGPGCHIRGLALPGTEPRRRPGLALGGAKVVAHVVEQGRHFFLREFLHEAEKLLVLYAHARGLPRPGGHRSGAAGDL